MTGHMLYKAIYRRCPEQASPQRQDTGEWSSGAVGRDGEQLLMATRFLSGQRQRPRLRFWWFHKSVSAKPPPGWCTLHR